MPSRYEVNYGVFEKIVEYAKSVEPNTEAFLSGLNREFLKLAENPDLGSVPRGAYGYSVYIGQVKQDDAVYYFRVSYDVDEARDVLSILGFKPQDL